ncbi:hypothetical protein [Parerythrobacter jejuensis]|uniref:Secreted protein n=1 Tax=Parerythrobacter jejuensis TaxID=795812 RepID=A0A845AZC3_9SPHN|nr:hypothetical protein [Parerythrobacter jejuensis]MXP31096.1 hypothetical protein [Parerythrobacter jejuensis]MXP33856.1 hypothetical protein [Parerythrobacter jejuensis]
MKKLLAMTAAGLLVFGSTASLAETRPGATEFAQPVSSVSDIGNQDEDDDGDGKKLWLFLLLGLAAIGGIIAAAGSSQGNSPR